MCVFTSSVPGVGEGKIVNRESVRAYGTAETEKPLYLPEEKTAKYYTDLATAAAGRQVCVCVRVCCCVPMCVCVYSSVSFLCTSCLCVERPRVCVSSSPHCRSA